MEKMEEDGKFFKLLANVDGEKRKIKRTNSEPKAIDAYNFWEQVEEKYIKMLAEHYAYKYDFELFGYSIQQYADDIGLELT